jgi:queuine/archaeosine tRNA-ribosyltransferase
MSDVYIIYARENRETAQKVYDLLARRWKVWWDDHIVGDYNRAIKTNLAKTKCIVALYSVYADKPAVTEELRLGEKYNKIIIPLELDDSDAPYPYGHYSSIDFRQWNGEAEHPGVKLLHTKIGTVVEGREQERIQVLAGEKLPIPNIFMSVSSHETQFDPVDALKVLKAHSTSSILVSAYDLVNSANRAQMISHIKSYRDNGGLVLIDSGNYEAQRLEDEQWKPNDFHKALKDTPHDWAFSFDEMNPSSDPREAIEQIISAVKRDSKFTPAPVFPIIHVDQGEEGLARLPEIVREVSKQLRPQVIALPERELGAGLAMRAKTMKMLRKELDCLPYYQPIHLLGTGNPWSIAVLVAAGADTFDGLEWCRFAVDPVQGRLHHFQHFDFFQDKATRTQFLDLVDATPEIEYAGRVALYNLEYYKEFGRDMRDFISTNDARLFALGVMNAFTSEDLKKLFPEIFT